MPTYEYACDPCRIIYLARHGINDSRPGQVLQVPRPIAQSDFGTQPEFAQHSSPTEAKYANLSVSDEIAKEKELQKVYETIWIPPEVKHSPWEEDHY